MYKSTQLSGMESRLTDLIHRIFPYYNTVYTSLYGIEPHLRNFIPQESTVCIFIADHFVYDNMEIPTNNHLVSKSIKAIHTFARKNHNNNIIVIQYNRFIDRELSQLSAVNNLYILETSSGMYQEYSEYTKIQPIIDKIFTKNRYILCLNNNPRPHRIGTIMYLLHRQLNSKLLMSFMSLERRGGNGANTEHDYNTFLNWANFNAFKIRKSFSRLNERKYGNFPFLVETVYDDVKSDNSTNFIKRLAPHYEGTFIEIITESTCIESSVNLTEKYINSIFGCCFPILISTQGTVNLLRNLGFDMFDDIINHGYDDEPNHFYRMKKAIDWNYKLLRDGNKLKQLWKNNHYRFVANVEHYKNNLYDDEFNRLSNELSAICMKINYKESL